MRPADRQSAASAAYRRQQVRPGQYRYSPPPGLGDLDVARFYGRRKGHEIGVADIGGIVADEGLNAESAEALEDRRALHVAARYAMAHGHEHGGDPVHAGAAHADEVEPARAHRSGQADPAARGQDVDTGASLHRSSVPPAEQNGPARSSTSRATSSAAFGRAKALAAAAMTASAVRQLSAAPAPWPDGPVQLLVRDYHRPAGGRPWPSHWHPGGPRAHSGNGTRTAGTPANASSATVLAPARCTAMSAAP